MSSKVLTEFDAGVLTITLADVGNRNALSAALVRELSAALDRAEADDVRVVVVTNEGRIFCAGADLSEQSTSGGGVGELAMLFRRIRVSPKPFVGRIAGHAVAGGMGLAAAMDLSVAVEDAKFGFTEVRVGVAPAMISVVCLPKMRRADAADAFLRGRRFLAPEAVSLGLINQAVPADQLDDAVGEIVSDLLAGGPNAVGAAKGLLTAVPSMDFEEALTWTAQLSAQLFASDEAREGMTAYLEKRRPSWAPPET